MFRMLQETVDVFLEKKKKEHCSFSSLLIHTGSTGKARFVMNPESLRLWTLKPKPKVQGWDIAKSSFKYKL